MLFSSLFTGRKPLLLQASVLIALIALADWRIQGNIPLGFLYLFPMLLVGSVLSRWQIGVVAVLCTFLTESFDSFAWSPEIGAPRDILIFAAFFGMGLFVYEVARNRRAAQAHLHQIECEIQARREAEEQLNILVDSSPAAIFTTNSDGVVLLANDAAHRLLALPSGKLRGRSIREYLPSLVYVPAVDDSSQAFRTVMQCRGRRQDGEVFLADVWFSTYRTSLGPRLAAMVLDTSEELRTREEFSLHQLMTASRILIGAVSHEIRNVSGAIAMIHANLARTGTLAQNKDFDALGTLIAALEKMAALELGQTANQATFVDLNSILEELRIVVESSLVGNGIDVHWEVEAGLPHVWADRQSLMQAFLNLTKNSERALLNQSRRELTIHAKRDAGRITVRFQDSGRGVANPDRLFQPFQQYAEMTGLGLYVSRALMRSFRGDLRYEPVPQGACFVVDLSLVVSGSGKENHGDQHFVGGRSQLVSGKP